MIYKNDRHALLALPLSDKEVISNAYRAFTQERKGQPYYRVVRSALMLAVFCGIWWLTPTDLIAEIEKQIPTVFGFGVQSLMNVASWLCILAATVILAIELMLAHKANKESFDAIADARKLGVDVTTIDAWLLKQLEEDVYKAYQQKFDQKLLAVPAQFEGREWEYNFDPDSYFQFRKGFLHWLDCGSEKDEVYRSYFDAVRNGDRIDKHLLWNELNKTPLASFKSGAVGLVLVFVSIALGFWQIDGLLRALPILFMFISMAFMFRLNGFIRRDELLPNASYSDSIRKWEKYHPELYAFAARNGLYGSCSGIEFYLLRDYVHTVRSEIFRANNTTNK